MAQPKNPKNPMTPDAASRIQSSEAKKNDGKIEKGSWSARAQSSAAKNENNEALGAREMDQPKNPKNPMTAEDASRIQSIEAKKNDGKTEEGSWPARAQAAAARNEKKQ